MPHILPRHPLNSMQYDKGAGSYLPAPGSNHRHSIPRLDRGGLSPNVFFDFERSAGFQPASLSSCSSVVKRNRERPARGQRYDCFEIPKHQDVGVTSIYDYRKVRKVGRARMSLLPFYPIPISGRKASSWFPGGAWEPGNIIVQRFVDSYAYDTFYVIPAKAGIQRVSEEKMDSRLRGNDNQNSRE